MWTTGAAGRAKKWPTICAATFRRRRKARVFEVNLDALAWLERIARALEAGFVFTIDYGYTRAESVRFPRGTLMSYRRHQADEDVLDDPGARDITAHVAFTALEEHGARLGLRDGALRNAGADAARRGRARSVRRRAGGLHAARRSCGGDCS